MPRQRTTNQDQPPPPPPRSIFAKNFWSKDDSGFEVLMFRMRQAKQTCEEVRQMYMGRIKIEEDYGRQLLKLAKSPLGRDEIGTLRCSLDTVRDELEAVGRSHLDLASQMRLQLERPLCEFMMIQRDKRKIQQTKVEKTRRHKQLHTSYVNKAKEKHEAEITRCKDIEAQVKSSSGRDLEKIEVKLLKCRQNVRSTEKEYKSALEGQKAALKKWKTDWTAACNQYQEMEEERITYLRSYLWNYANILSTVCVSDDESCERIRSVLEKCDIEKDILMFVKEKGTGAGLSNSVDDLLNGDKKKTPGKNRKVSVEHRDSAAPMAISPSSKSKNSPRGVASAQTVSPTATRYNLLGDSTDSDESTKPYIRKNPSGVRNSSDEEDDDETTSPTADEEGDTSPLPLSEETLASSVSSGEEMKVERDAKRTSRRAKSMTPAQPGKTNASGEEESEGTAVKMLPQSPWTKRKSVSALVAQLAKIGSNGKAVSPPKEEKQRSPSASDAGANKDLLPAKESAVKRVRDPVSSGTDSQPKYSAAKRTTENAVSPNRRTSTPPKSSEAECKTPDRNTTKRSDTSPKTQILQPSESATSKHLSKIPLPRSNQSPQKQKVVGSPSGASSSSEGLASTCPTKPKIQEKKRAAKPIPKSTPSEAVLDQPTPAQKVDPLQPSDKSSDPNSMPGAWPAHEPPANPHQESVQPIPQDQKTSQDNAIGRPEVMGEEIYSNSPGPLSRCPSPFIRPRRNTSPTTAVAQAEDSRPRRFTANVLGLQLDLVNKLLTSSGVISSPPPTAVPTENKEQKTNGRGDSHPHSFSTEIHNVKDKLSGSSRILQSPAQLYPPPGYSTNQPAVESAALVDARSGPANIAALPSNSPAGQRISSPYFSRVVAGSHSPLAARTPYTSSSVPMAAKEKSMSPQMVEPHLASIPVANSVDPTLTQTKYKKNRRRPQKSLLHQCTSDGVPILFWARALYDFNATIPEEISFRRGDAFAVLEVLEDGWWEAEKQNPEVLDAGRNGVVAVIQRGLIPSNFMSRLE
ncbi:uncharacterized protein VTP21DRAFT_7831 [Calcarisporiella thermophila]|uniref:uncharacterized protein n=1 Tax=Calcarisporiella thermophila TaxID=911321 RepID=UPI003743E353